MRIPAAVSLILVAVSAALAQTTQSPALDKLSPAQEINSVLPSWVKFGGEYRARFEGYTGGSFKPDTSDSYMLSRLELNLTIRPTTWLNLFVEGYDARAFAKSPALPPYQNTWDIRQGYVEIGDTEKQTFGLRVGRQELNYGDQRLIGALPWANTARTFDAIRGTYRHDGIRVDLFVSSVVVQTDGTWDHHQQGNNLHGIYGGFDKLIKKATIEPYALWRLQPRVKNEEGILANVDEKIIGLRWVGKLPMGFDYGAELVDEFGSLGADEIRAEAAHVVFGDTFDAVWSKPRIFGEFNYASGDKNAKDGTRGTFDQLYPTGHDKYGLADQIGWRNMKNVRAGVQTRPLKKVTAAFVYNDWYLASATDSLYNAAGASIAKSATGVAGTHVGQEFDVVGTWAIIKPLTAGVGFGHIFPGPFLKLTTPGNSYNYPYVMFTYKF